MLPTLGRRVLSKCDWSINGHNDVEEHQHCMYLRPIRVIFNVKSWLWSISIGMGFSKKEVIGQMALLVSPSALSLLEIPFCIISEFRIKQEHFGTIHITVCPQGDYLWLHSNVATATQYCDGLRGALVVYDPNDPHRSMWVDCRSDETPVVDGLYLVYRYDFDAGMIFNLYEQWLPSHLII